MKSGAIASTFTYVSVSASSPLITVTVTDSSGVTSVPSSAPSVIVYPFLVAPSVTSMPATVNQGQVSSLSSSNLTTGASPYIYQWL